MPEDVTHAGGPRQGSTSDFRPAGPPLASDIARTKVIGGGTPTQAAPGAGTAGGTAITEVYEVP